MTKEFYSNGKLLLTAEYLVLDGAQALALPTQFGQKLIVLDGEEGVVHWKSLDADGTIWYENEIQIATILDKNPLYQQDDITEMLIRILNEAHAQNPQILKKNKGYQIETQLTFPKNWGLGTSSTLINNIAQWLQIDAFILLKNSFGGSGYDIACAQNNTPVLYAIVEDKPIIEKVIFNVLSNAFKYTPNKGTIEIEIKPTWREEIEYFIILIKDSGKGISQLDKKKIFQRHFHGKDRSSSGIGLHLASTLIKAHKGEINVLNSSLGGTEFMITLPVSSKAFDEEEFLSKDDIPINLPEDYVPGDILEKNNDEESDKEKILVVEDDYDLRKYLKYILSNDYIVYEAANGEKGLEIAQQKIPDIIITDVMMPEMNGIEMCKKIKKNTLISHIPVLMLTAKTGDEFYNKGLKVGAWDYIAKPFNSQQLLQKINNIAETRNSFRQYLAKGASNKTQNHYVSYDQKFVKNAIEIIQRKMTEPNFTVEDLSEEMNLSRMQLHRKLKSLTGQSATKFINSMKIAKAVTMFDKGCDRVQEAMDAVGINSYAHFISLFKEEKGMTPSKYIETLKKELEKK